MVITSTSTSTSHNSDHVEGATKSAFSIMSEHKNPTRKKKKKGNRKRASQGSQGSEGLDRKRETERSQTLDFIMKPAPSGTRRKHPGTPGGGARGSKRGRQAGAPGDVPKPKRTRSHDSRIGKDTVRSARSSKPGGSSSSRNVMQSQRPRTYSVGPGGVDIGGVRLDPYDDNGHESESEYEVGEVGEVSSGTSPSSSDSATQE